MSANAHGIIAVTGRPRYQRQVTFFLYSPIKSEIYSFKTQYYKYGRSILGAFLSGVQNCPI